MACSLDGTLAYLEFTVAELGKSMTDQEKVNFKLCLIAVVLCTNCLLSLIIFSNLGYLWRAIVILSNIE